MKNKEFFTCLTTSIKIIFLSLILCFSAGKIYAQDNTDSTREESWNFILAPYILSPNIDGTAGLSLYTVDVGVNPGDIFSNLDFGAMLYFEMNKGKWAFTFDGLYMDLGKKGEIPISTRKAELDITQLEIELTAFYRATEWLEVGLGGRLSNIKQGIYASPGLFNNEIDASDSNTWFDPLIAARFNVDVDNLLFIRLRTDIGGFGLGSDFSWQIHPAVGYRFSPTFELGVGYRWLGMDYETGQGNDYFMYDLVDSGLEMSFIFHF